MTVMTREQEKQVEAALAAIDESNAQWRAVHAILDEAIRLELDALLVPDLGDEGAHYNRGRVAALESFKQTLSDTMLKTRTPA
jgi:hypothetical protein